MGFVTPRLAGVGALVMAGAVIFGSPAGASAIPLHNTVVRTTAAVEGSVYVPSGRTLRLGMRGHRNENEREGDASEAHGSPPLFPPWPYGSILPGFISPLGSSAALMRRIRSSSAPPRHSGIM